MSVNSEIYTVLAAIFPDDCVFDTKRPDSDEENYTLTYPLAVFQLVSDVPAVPIDGTIIGQEQRWQISIFSDDLAQARALRNAVVSALHGYEGTAINRADLEMTVELYDPGTVPPEYHIATDFTIQS